MAIKEIKKYKIECDFCERFEILERAESGIMSSPRPPSGWKRTTWKRPRVMAAGQASGYADHCPACKNKEVSMPNNAIDVKIEEY